MRKTITIIIGVLFALSASAERVSQEDAALVANQFMSAASSATNAKKAPARPMVRKTAAAQADDTQYYVYENADGEGWVIVSANDVVRPILAYSNTGSFRTDNMPVNVKTWLGKYDKFIRRLEDDGVSAGEETTEEWTAVRRGARRAKQATAVVGPLLTTQWDQDEPYNLLCPGTGTWGPNSTKAATGCVATAMAQVMNYWQWPVKGTGSHTYQPLDPNNSRSQSARYGEQSADFGATTYDWANMKKKHYTSDTQARKKAISTLMYHCGVASEMMYGNYEDGGSGTYTVNYGEWDTGEMPCAQNALYNFFGYKQPVAYKRDGYSYGRTTIYTKWTDAAWTAMITEELDKQHPIMYAGASSEGGHSFVCDGYDSDGYFHFNWGWSGDCDGYFLLSNLNPGGDGIGGGGYNFSEDQDVLIGIEPDIAGHEVVVNGSGCVIVPSAMVAENDKALTAAITPVDETYDFTSITVTLGSTTLEETTHYTLSADHRTLTIKASAITGDVSDALTITAIWTKNRYKYEWLGENCTPEAGEGILDKDAALNLTIRPDSGYTLDDAACWDVEMGGTALAYGNGCTYDALSGTFTISQVTGDVAIFIYGGKSVTWIADGEETATTMALSNRLTLPANGPEVCEGKAFVGWTAIADYESESVAPPMVKSGDTADSSTYYAVFATLGGKTIIADTLTRATTGASGTQYKAWSGKQLHSDAVYAGNSAGGNGAIQLRTSNSNSGIVTTTPGGQLARISVVWNSNTTNGRKLNIYGRNDTYTALSDLYNEEKQGTLLGTIVCGTSTELAIEGEYTYIGLRSAASALYLDAITFTWDAGASYCNYSTTLNCQDIPEAVEQTGTGKPAAEKAIRNGQIVIIRGEAVYSITGILIH
ncbi:MAG: C10 family peptidase [Paludibacteraceae bacterium]|nr:C10 family peptidase [Paludibacteraceae bacterium]